VGDSRRNIGEMRHRTGRRCNPTLGKSILSSAAGNWAAPGGDPISHVTTKATAASLRQLRSAGRLVPPPAPPRDRVRVGVCVESEWAGRAVARALGEAGAVAVHLQSSAITPRALAGSAALVYDLNPWTQTAARRFGGLVHGLLGGPILLYLPASGPAFTTYSQLPRAGDIRVQVQSRDADSMAHLRDAAVGLVRAVPRVWIMDELRRAAPGLSSASYLFGHRALGVLASGRRPSVAAIARALGLSQRTLQRRVRADGLPSPKALLDWLTLAHLRHVSHVQKRSVARVAADLELAANDLYRLRKRVLHRAERLGGDGLMPQRPGEDSGGGPDFIPLPMSMALADAPSPC
jgi:AraC-like DNA-binding protein